MLQEEENEVMQKDQHIKLLILEDNKEILDYLQDYFNQVYNVSIASDGQKALDLLEIQSYHIVISAVMMPELDGLHFLQKSKAKY